MKIVVPDGYVLNPGDLSWDGVRELGELTVFDYTPNNPDAIVERIGDADAVLINKLIIDGAVMDRCPNLKYIGVQATGYNVVDIKAAVERGVTVTNVPAYSTPSVAQFAFALLLELACHTGHHDNAVKNGRWISNRDFCFWDYPIMELDGKTIGIIGFGNIGRAVGRIAKAFGMNVLAYGSRPCDEGKKIGEYVSLDYLLAHSDVISLHAPLFPETYHIINKNSISKMKDGVVILNTARGALIDQNDLYDALVSGKISGAGLDVVEVEPMSKDNPLIKAPNCVITPHIAWASLDARQRLLDIVVENIRCWQAGKPQNVVSK